MNELEQSLENLDELRKEAKSYASTIVLPNNERLSLYQDDDKTEELLAMRETQEEVWQKPIFEGLKNSFIGIINSVAKKKLAMPSQIKSTNYAEEINKTVEKADELLTQENLIPEINSDQNQILENIPTSIVEKINNNEPIQLEKEEIQIKTLAKKKGSAFNSILLVVTTLTVGIIAGMILLK